MRALLTSAALVAALVLVPSSVGAQAHAAAFPSAGTVVPGQSIGGVKIGMTQAQVKQIWGAGYQVCGTCGPDLTWLYIYPGGNAALGAAVKFSTPAPIVTTSSSASSAAKAAAATAVALANKAKLAETKAATAEAAAKKATGTRAASLKAAAKTAEAAAAAAKAAAAKAAATAAKDAAAAKSPANPPTASTTGNVVAVFTLGSPVGWGIKGQILMGDPISNVYNVFGNPGTANCIGYSALTVRIGSSTTSVYSASGVVYGFALTAPTQSPCQ